MLRCAPFYKDFDLLLPFPILVDNVTASFDLLNRLLILKFPVDPDFFLNTKTKPDPGSKAWLLAAALQDSERDVEYDKKEEILKKKNQEPKDEYAEDKHHLKTASLEEEEESEYQEDKFHKVNLLFIFLFKLVIDNF